MQKVRLNIIILWVVLVLLVLWIIILSVWLATLGRSGQSQAQATYTYEETFDTTTYQEPAATDAVWDTSLGEVYLPSGTGGIYNADRETPGVGTVGGSGVTWVELAVDASDSPHLAMGASGLKYATWDDTQEAWVGADGTPGLEDVVAALGGTFTAADIVDIEITSTGQPAIAWEDLESGDQGVFFTQYIPGTGWAKADGTPGFDTVESTPGFGFNTVRLALDSADRPNISYSQSSDVFFERWNGVAYVPFGASTNVTGTGTVSGSLTDHSLVLASNDEPHIVWSDNVSGSGDILYVRGNDTLDIWEDVSGAAYSAACLGTTCAATTVIANAAASVRPDIDLDSSDLPHLVWQDLTPGPRNEIFYTSWSGSAWVDAPGGSAGSTQLSSSASLSPGDGAFFARIKIDPFDMPVALWEEKTVAGIPGGKSIMGTRWNGNFWATLDGVSPGVTDFSGSEATIAIRAASLAVDSFGNAGGAWRSSGDAIFGAFWFVPYLTPATAQSLEVDEVSDNIAAATLSSTFMQDGGDVNFYLSNDGGTTFEGPVTLDTEHVFTTQGSSLKWKAELVGDSGDLSTTPVIQGLSIMYQIEAPAPGLTIDRIEGQDPTEQSINVSQQRFPTTGSASVGFISRDDLLVDSFTSAPLVSRTGGTLLLNDRATLESGVLTEFERALAPGATIFVVGGTEAISQSVQDALGAAGFTTQRVGGVNRLETAAELSRELVARNGEPTTKCFLTEDQALVDALGTGAVAGNLSDGLADCILLSRRGDNALDPFTKAFIDEHPELLEVELIGGPVALPAAVQTTLQTNYPTKTINRIEGANRFATNINLVEANFVDPGHVVVASGQKESIPGALSATGQSTLSALFFDALLAGPFAAGDLAPLVLVRTATLPDETAAYLVSVKDTVTNVTIVGSEAEVSAAVEEAIRQALQ